MLNERPEEFCPLVRLCSSVSCCSVTGKTSERSAPEAQANALHLFQFETIHWSHGIYSATNTVFWWSVFLLELAVVWHFAFWTLFQAKSAMHLKFSVQETSTWKWVTSGTTMLLFTRTIWRDGFVETSSPIARKQNVIFWPYSRRFSQVGLFIEVRSTMVWIWQESGATKSNWTFFLVLRHSRWSVPFWLLQYSPD